MTTQGASGVLKSWHPTSGEGHILSLSAKKRVQLSLALMGIIPTYHSSGKSICSAPCEDRRKESHRHHAGSNYTHTPHRPPRLLEHLSPTFPSTWVERGWGGVSQIFLHALPYFPFCSLSPPWSWMLHFSGRAHPGVPQSFPFESCSLPLSQKPHRCSCQWSLRTHPEGKVL